MNSLEITFLLEILLLLFSLPKLHMSSYRDDLHNRHRGRFRIGLSKRLFNVTDEGHAITDAQSCQPKIFPPSDLTQISPESLPSSADCSAPDESQKNRKTETSISLPSRPKVVATLMTQALESTMDVEAPDSTKSMSVLSMASIGGTTDSVIPSLNIYSSSKKGDFSRKLQEEGIISLLFPEAMILFKKGSQNEESISGAYHNGFWGAWWARVFETGLCDCLTIKSHDLNVSESLYYSLKSHFPSDSRLSHVVCHVNNVIMNSIEEPIIPFTPQLFVSCRNGFSTRFWQDDTAPLYRYFLYMGREADVQS